MKKMIGTKVRRTIAGQLAFATAMIFSVSGNMMAQQVQTISAPSLDDVTYGVAPFSVSATSTSGLSVSYGVAGPAAVDTDGLLTVLGKGSVTVFFFQGGNASYHIAAPVVKSFTVNGATATVTLADASAAYTGTGQSLTPTQTDSGGTALSEPISVTYTDAAGAAVASPTNVGVYTATATITTGSNYSGSDTATLTITKAAATVTISETSQSHDGSQHPVTVVTVPAGLTVTTTYTGGSFAPAAAVAAVDAVTEVLYVTGDTLPSGKAVGDVKTAAVTAVVGVAAVTAPSTAGDYAVSVTVVDDSYSGTASATLTVGSVTIDNTAAAYTSAAQAPPVTLVPSDLTHTVTYTNSAGTAVTSPTKADTYTVLVTVSDTRYPGDTSASYTINPAALTADLGDLSTVYGLAAPSSADWAATLTYSGFVGGETASTDVVAAVAAVAAVDAVAEVLYVTGDTLPDGKAVGDVKTAAVTAVAAVPAVVTTGLTVSYDKAVSDAGSYVATPAGLSSSNYAITYSVGALTVTKMGTTIALTNTSQGYTSSVLAVTATPAIDGLTVDVVYKEENADNTFSVVESPTAQGTYYVTATINDTNHSGSATGTLTITKATTTLSLADLPDVVFSSAPITAVATVDEGRTVNYFVTGAASASGNVITLLNAGTVTVEAYVAETDDYGYAYVLKTFTVTKAPTSVTLGGASVVYTGLGQSVTASVADSGGAALTVGVDIVYTDAAGAAVASPTVVGDYTVTATVNDTKYGGSATDTLRILKAPLTITADDQTKEYLQANPTLTLTYTGFQNSEDSSVLSTQATVGTGADASSSLGEYGIVVYGAAAANYAITHVDGALTVEKNTIVITLTGTDVTYTGSAFAVTATPSVAGVSVVVTYADAAGAAVASPTNAGTYTVSATADSALYQGTQTGTLTIAKATATVTLSDLAATYNGSAKVAAATTVPAGLTVDLTYSQGSTLVAPITAVAAVTAVDAVAATYEADGTTIKTAAVAAVAAVTAVTGVTGPSSAGTYAIVGSVNEDNYSGYITGDLVIAKKALSATADALAKTYGSANPAATITYSGFENSEDATVLDTAPAATIGADATSGVGDYDITLSAGTDSNYEITTANGKLTVGKAVVAVTAADVTKIYGAAVDEFSFEAYGDAVEAVSGTAILRIYANDGAVLPGTGTFDSTDYGAKMPGTLLYTSDAISLKDGYQTYTVTGIKGLNLRDKVTWTVEFSAGSTAGLVLGGTDVVGSSLNDFWQNDAAGWTLYQPDSGSEGGDFAAKLSANVTGDKTPGTLLFTSDPITLSEGYKTYQVDGINVELPDTVTWTVEFTGVTGNELNVGNRAALVLSGTDVVGSSYDDFWQKDASGWMIYQTGSSSQTDDFAAKLFAQSWRLQRDTDSVVLDNFGAKVTAGVNVDFLETANIPLVVINPGLQADWGAADNATYAEGAALPSGTAAPERRAFVSSTDDSTAIGQAIDYVLETGFTTSPSGSELEAGESVTLSAVGYGPGDVTYQWKKDGANIDAQTGADLALSVVAKAAAGTYSVVVTGSNGGQAEASAEVKVFGLPDITLNRPVEGSTTSAITHQIKIWSIGGEDAIDIATGSITVNGVNVTASANVSAGRRGLQATVDLVENADPDTIPGLFLGYETLAAGTNNAMTVTLAFEVVGGDRVFTKSWTYTLYDANSSGGSDITKMAVNQIFQRGEDLYVIWPGSPGLMLERNSDCRGGVWEPIQSTVGKGIHVEKNCGTKAFFRLVRVKG